MNDNYASLINSLKEALPKRPVFKISFADDNVTYLNSHIGSPFYWPDTDTPEFQFLAQINFAELPENDIFPKEGILQFFIGDDDAYGLFSDRGYLVVYHKAISIDGIEVYKATSDSPIIRPARMVFELTEESMPFSDYRFSDYFDMDSQTDDMQEAMYEALCSEGSRLLGYPYFTQYDPREDKVYHKYDTLLFQLDSESGYIMWGDCGVGNFFIPEENLKKLDFSDVFYSWDCC